MGKSNFSDEFKWSAVQQITEQGHLVAQRLGESTHSLYELQHFVILFANYF